MENDPGVSSFGRSGIDLNEYRAAELVLNLAEAACGSDDDKLEEAYTLLKSIRQRVGYTGECGLDPAIRANRDKMFAALLYERQIEFAYEGKRFDDMRRWMLYNDDFGTCTRLGVKPLNGQRRHGIYLAVRPEVIQSTQQGIEQDKLNPESPAYDPSLVTREGISLDIDASPARLLEALAHRVAPVESSYAALWHDKEQLATRLHDDYIARIGWCDLKAFSLILPVIPAGTALQLSNGTTVRYAQLFNTPQVSRSDCNRGVCGIDGSTSTAAGASCVGDATTLFITGDMSFSYDANGLSSAYLSPRFKVIVMCNGGGGIFRFIKPTAGLPELERCFEVHRDIPVEKYADLFGLRYFEIDSETSAAEVLPRFFAENERPAILAVHTPHLYNAEVLRGYFRRARQ